MIGDITKRVGFISVGLYILAVAVLGILGILGYFTQDEVVTALIRIAGVMAIASLAIIMIASLNTTAQPPTKKKK